MRSSSASRGLNRGLGGEGGRGGDQISNVLKNLNLVEMNVLILMTTFVLILMNVNPNQEVAMENVLLVDDTVLATRYSWSIFVPGVPGKSCTITAAVKSSACDFFWNSR